MTTLGFTSPTTHAHSTLLQFSKLPSQNAFTVSFYPIPKSSLLFPSISLRPFPMSRTDKVRRHPSIIVSALKNLAETDLVPIPPETDAIPGIFPSSSGVYAVYDGNDDLQFIGISRNIATSVVTHRKSVPQLCFSIKVIHYYFPWFTLLVSLSLSGSIQQFWALCGICLFCCYP